MSTLSDLQTFVAAVRAGSFAGTARQLAISPAMVGRRIDSLERRYGARLIERTTRKQRLTPLGEAFLAQAETVLEAVAELEDMARVEPGRLAGRIRVTGPATLGIHRLAAITARFCGANPDVTVEMSLNDRRSDIVAEGFDLAVRIGDLEPSAMIVRRVGTYRFRVCAAPDYLARYGAPERPDELHAHHSMLNVNMTPRNRWPFVAPDGTEATTEVAGTLQIDNGEALLAAALAGAGIVYLPDGLVAEHIAAGHLIELFPDWQKVTMPIQILQPGRRLVPRRVTAYIDALAAGLRD
jgi:DNA-binding transcriptional LysR family regulator